VGYSKKINWSLKSTSLYSTPVHLETRQLHLQLTLKKFYS